MIIDLHIHTKYSGDSSNDPVELVKAAKAKGLDGIAVTDHDSVKAWEHFPEDDDFTIIQGIERTTDHGSVIGLFLTEGIEARGFWEAVEEIKSQDGIVVLPHPCDALRRDTPKIGSLDESLLRARVDAVEVFNSRCVLGQFNENAEKLAADLGRHRVGGSDAHTLGEVGNTRTLFDCDSLNEIHIQLKRRAPINTVIQGSLSSRLVHLSSFLNRMKGKE
ncbi:PHP domain-containing protein [Candidatus Bathyarchaeota archaeon]|nr:PHP domain-containing protein [Candidatus Bathyarchaeota archaeon]MBL7078780.1 PHP domain-containing protein [Candidatus Bathyarchaeota archaeon]